MIAYVSAIFFILLLRLKLAIECYRFRNPNKIIRNTIEKSKNSLFWIQKNLEDRRKHWIEDKIHDFKTTHINSLYFFYKKKNVLYILPGYFLNILRINVHAIAYLPRTRWFVVFTWYIRLFKKHKLFQLYIFFRFFITYKRGNKTVLKKYCYNNNDDICWDSYVFIQPIETTNFCYLFFNILYTYSLFIVFCTS